MLDIVILAAGKGTRMRSDLPKVLHTLGGKPLVSHVVETARCIGGDQLIVVVGHGAELVEQELRSPDIRFAVQAQQLGTGHAVQQAQSLLRDDAKVLILYGDVPLTKPDTLEKLIANVSATQMALLTVNLANPTGYGRIKRDTSGKVIAIVEHKDATSDELGINEVNTGILAAMGYQLKSWLSKLDNNNAQGEYYLTDVIAMAVADGVGIHIEQPHQVEEVEGINNRLQQAILERFHQKQIAIKLMNDGVTLIDPQRFDCRGKLSTGRDVLIDVNCIFEGNVELGDGVVIEANCVIKNAVIGHGTHIKPFSHIEGAVIGSLADIGPYARLRPGTELADKVKIGNFVETKKAVIGLGSKVNHLSYVGDAKVGNGVNVGAGTITCNYDGVNKFATEIGDNAFIGSNSALVAPVKIGAGATIGAGSTVTKDVEVGELTVARARQRNIQGWQRPVKVEK